MNGKTVMACIDAAYASLKEHTDEIALLDQQIGDGDHIFNLLRGMEALLAVRSDIEGAAFGPALEIAASKVLSTVGGSSGPLFFSLLSGMSKASERHALDTAGFAHVFAAGVEAVGQRGKTGVGSKTMMDVLIPVAKRFDELAAQGATARRGARCVAAGRGGKHARYPRYAGDQRAGVVSRRTFAWTHRSGSAFESDHDCVGMRAPGAS